MSSAILSLYKKSLREAQCIPNTNIREYIIRKIKSSYRLDTSPNVTSQESLESLESLKQIKRYRVISSLYFSDNYHKKVI